MNLKPKATSKDPKSGFIAKESAFRNWISEDSDRFKPESGRYHLYISNTCPFAHRTNIVRNLKGLQDHIGLSIVHPVFQKTKPEVDNHAGWVFRKEGDKPLSSHTGNGSFPCEGVIPDTVNGFNTIRDLYEASNDKCGKYAVPVLWDKKENVIVNNESSEIIRMFNSVFNHLSKAPLLDLYPEELRDQIDKINNFVYQYINTGVYKAGFAQKQDDYIENVNNLFNALDKIEEILSKNRFLCGQEFTESDIRLFTTLVRFDEVYFILFKCNKKGLVDYPNILNYTREIYQIPGVHETVNMDHIKNGYFANMTSLNTNAVVPIGRNFLATLKERHDRDRFGY